MAEVQRWKCQDPPTRPRSWWHDGASQVGVCAGLAVSLPRVGGLELASPTAAPRCTARCRKLARPRVVAQNDACSSRRTSRASSAALQAVRSTPSRDAHSRRTSGPLATVAQTDPKFHAGKSCRSFAKSSTGKSVLPYTGLYCTASRFRALPYAAHCDHEGRADRAMAADRGDLPGANQLGRAWPG